MSHWPMRRSKGKYGAKKVERAGYSFASKLEASLFGLLRLREMAGEISELKTQASVYLTDARILYKPDFSYLENGVEQFAESKGFETSDWRIKRRLWGCYGPGPLHIWKGSAARLAHHETITPKKTSCPHCGK
jgi:hypothetical protein